MVDRRPPIISVEPAGFDLEEELEVDPCKFLARYPARVACAFILYVLLLTAGNSFLAVEVDKIGPSMPRVQDIRGYWFIPSPDSGGSPGGGARPAPRTAPASGKPSGGKARPAAGASAAAGRGSKANQQEQPQEPARTAAPPRPPPAEAAAAASAGAARSPAAADADAAPSPSEREAARLRVFCFAWSPRRKRDELVMPYVRKLYSACDGHAFFTDEDAPGPTGEFIKVRVPRTQRKRKDELWLYHQNMVAIAPAWAYLFDHDMLENYDWVINAELDHFFRAALAKRCILDHLRVLREGSQRERKSLDGPVMLSWGNVFVFNQKMVRLMAKQWDRLGKAITSNKSKGMGCPELTASRAHSTGSCEQDMGYPGLPGALRPPAAKYGPEGCSQTRKTSKGVDLPFACWQDFPLGGADKQQIAALHEISLMRGIPTQELARRHCKTRGPQVEKACLSLFRAVDVPVMHNVKTPAVHKAAQEELPP